MAGHIFGRSTATSLPFAVAGDGCYLIDSTGKRYLDGSGGAAVSCLAIPIPMSGRRCMRSLTGWRLHIRGSSPVNPLKPWPIY